MGFLKGDIYSTAVVAALLCFCSYQPNLPLEAFCPNFFHQPWLLDVNDIIMPTDYHIAPGDWQLTFILVLESWYDTVGHPSPLVTVY